MPETDRPTDAHSVPHRIAPSPAAAAAGDAAAASSNAAVAADTASIDAATAAAGQAESQVCPALGTRTQQDILLEAADAVWPIKGPGSSGRSWVLNWLAHTIILRTEAGKPFHLTGAASGKKGLHS